MVVFQFVCLYYSQIHNEKRCEKRQVSEQTQCMILSWHVFRVNVINAILPKNFIKFYEFILNNVFDTNELSDDSSLVLAPGL